MRWLARSVEALPADLNWLAPAEVVRARRLRFAKRRTEYLLRRLVGKHAVATVAGLPPDTASLPRIEITNDVAGAPHVLLDGQPAGLEISLTDRVGWAVCLVGGQGDGIGCDLELVEPRSPAFVRDFFTTAEQAYVASRPDDNARQVAANLIWSAKESALKALRTGLQRDTRDVEIVLGGAGVWIPTESAERAPAQPGAPGRPRDDGAGWRSLIVRCPGGPALPGWWRRDGAFVFTAVAAESGPAPVALEHPGVLAAASPFPAVYRLTG